MSDNVRPKHQEGQAPAKMFSQAWSTSTLDQGIAIVQGQQMKDEADDEELQSLNAELQDSLYKCFGCYMSCHTPESEHLCSCHSHSPAFPVPLPPGALTSVTTPQRALLCVCMRYLPSNPEP